MDVVSDAKARSWPQSDLPQCCDGKETRPAERNVPKSLKHPSTRGHCATRKGPVPQARRLLPELAHETLQPPRACSHLQGFKLCGPIFRLTQHGRKQEQICSTHAPTNHDQNKADEPMWGPASAVTLGYPATEPRLNTHNRGDTTSHQGGFPTEFVMPSDVFCRLAPSVAR